MDDIEKLKNELLAAEAAERAAKTAAEKFVSSAADLRKKIAALEEEAAKPKQWNMYLTPNGYLSSSPCEFAWGARVREGLRNNKPITVIEKKPIQVNAHIACVLSSHFGRQNDIRSKPWLYCRADVVRALKEAGIDAEVAA